MEHVIKFCDLNREIIDKMDAKQEIVFYLMRSEVEPEVRGLIILHVSQVMVSIVNHQEVRHDRHYLCQFQPGQLDL